MWYRIIDRQYKATVSRLIKDPYQDDYKDIREEITFKRLKLKKYKQIYNINKFIFLSYFKDDDYYEIMKHSYEDINCFLREDEILDILDYYYFNKDFIDYNNLNEINTRMSFEEYMKTLKKDI